MKRVQREEILARRVAPDLPAREVVGLDHDHVAWLHVQHGLVVDIPAAMRGHGPADHVLGHRQARVSHGSGGGSHLDCGPQQRGIPTANTGDDTHPVGPKQVA